MGQGNVGDGLDFCRLQYPQIGLPLVETIERIVVGADVVVRQNFSRGPKRGGACGVDVNTIIDSVQQGDPKRASPVRVERVYIKDRSKVDPNYAARL